MAEAWEIEWNEVVASMKDKNLSTKLKLEKLRKFSMDMSEMTGGKDHAVGYRTARAEFAAELGALIEGLG